MTSAPGRAPKRASPKRRWMIVRVVLAREAGSDLASPPGRDLLVSDGHAFAQLAEAIDRAFARWDRAHLHEFRLADGRRIGPADDDGDDVFDEADLTLAVLEGAPQFSYVFDIGAGWEHDCLILRAPVDPLDEVGMVPREILPVFGWGAIPDQYGRVTADEADA